MADKNALPEGFGEVDPDFMASAYAEAKKERSDTGGVVFLKPGITQVRVLPPHKDSPSWAYEYKEHGLHPNGEFKTFVCPQFLEVGECPICDKGAKLYATRVEADMEKAKRFRAKKAYLYNTYVYSSPDAHSLKDGIKVVKSGVLVYKQLMDSDEDKAGGYGDITNLTSGWDFRIDRQGKGRYKTTYNVKAIPERSNIIEKLKAEGFEIAIPADLTKIYIPNTLEEMNEALEIDEPSEDS